MSKVQLIILFAVLAVFSVSVTVVVVIHTVFDDARPSVKRCTEFIGSPSTATFRGCPKETVFGITCVPFMNNVLCHCTRDGVESASFTAIDPPLTDRAGAARIWTDQCARWER